MARSNVKTHTGNRCVVVMDGKTVGALQSVRFSDNYGLEDVSGIGDIHVLEHAPSKATHSLSVSHMVLFKQNLRDQDIAPENGDAVLRGLVFDIEVYQKDTGRLLRKAIGCSYDSGDIDVSAHRVVMATGQLKALDVVGTGF